MASPQPIKKAKAGRPTKPVNPLSIAPAGETDEQKKVRLATLREENLIRLSTVRVSKAIKSIQLIGNLATYKPTSEDVDAIEEALGVTCVGVVNRLRGGVKATVAFQLRTIK
jgi:hypothetical protein